MKKSSEIDCELLTYLSDVIPQSERYSLICDHPDFHDPDAFDEERFWLPLRAKKWPNKNLPDFCFVCGNLLVDFDSDRKRKLVEIYTSCLYLSSYVCCGSGLDMTSLAVRLLIEYDLQNPCDKIIGHLKSFLNSIYCRKEAPENIELVFINLGILYFHKDKNFYQYAKNKNHMFDEADSVNCPTRWRSILSRAS
jgi:hypothetical protein